MNTTRYFFLAIAFAAISFSFAFMASTAAKISAARL